MPLAARASNPLAGPSDFTPPRPLSRTALGTSETPDNAGEYPHYCPICMMHFKRILVTACCTNNLCEVCATELIEQHAAKAPLQRALRRTTAYKEQQLQQSSSARSGGIYLPDCSEPEPGVFDPMVPMSCPFCTRSLTLKAVQLRSAAVATPSHQYATDSVLPLRNYADSPAVVKQSNTGGATATTPTSRPASSTPTNHHQGASLHLTPAAVALRPPSVGQRPNTSGIPLRVPAAAVPMYSPVKTGDEFEALRRKLRPLDKIDPNSTVGKEHAKKEVERDQQVKALQQTLPQQPGVGGRPPLRPPSSNTATGAASRSRIVAGDGSVIASSRVPSATAQSASQRTRFPAAPAPRSSSNGSASRQQVVEVTRAASPKKKDSGFSCLVM